MGSCWRAFVFRGACENVSVSLVGGIDIVERVEVVHNWAKYQWWIALLMVSNRIVDVVSGRYRCKREIGLLLFHEIPRSSFL